MTYILFGLPGAGKTYVGRVFEKCFGYYLYDGDQELPEDMKQALEDRSLVTDEMRDEFFAKLLLRIKELQKKHSNLIIAQTYIKERYRKELLHEVPETKFILLETETNIREKRLRHRKEFPLDSEYARKMCELFDPPAIPHSVINNDEEGEEGIKKHIASTIAEV